MRCHLQLRFLFRMHAGKTDIRGPLCCLIQLKHTKKHSAVCLSSVLCFLFFSLLYFYSALRSGRHSIVLFEDSQNIHSAFEPHPLLTASYFRTGHNFPPCSDRSTPHTNLTAEGSDRFHQ